MYKSQSNKSCLANHHTALVLMFVLFMFSCSNLFIDEQRSNTAQNNIDLLWTIIDERYCFFEEKGVDWNAIREKYVRGWENYTNPSSTRLFNTMVQMLEELRDGHVCLDNGNFSRCYSGWHSGFPENFDGGRIRSYVNQDRNYDRLSNGTIFSILSDGVGYIRCPTFSGKFNRIDLDNAIARFNERNVAGVIIDVRNNGGGYVAEAYLLASKFARERTRVGYVRYKTGRGHSDFSDFFPRYVEPGGANQFHGKVVILTNRRVYSAANLFVSVMRSLPQVRVIGDQTGGGGGIPITLELYNGWAVKLSTNPVFDIKQNSIEQGIAPDQSIALTGNNNNRDNSNRDNIIEAAIEWILAK